MENRVKETAARLEEAVKNKGYYITADGRVSEEVAAELIGIAFGTLKNWRHSGKAPRHYKKPVSRCGSSYKIIDIAQWLENE